MSVQAIQQTDVFSFKAKMELNVNYLDFFFSGISQNNFKYVINLLRKNVMWPWWSGTVTSQEAGQFNTGQM